MGTYLPRRCGIATFTYDLSQAVEKAYNNTIGSSIIAMNTEDESIEYPPNVDFQIQDSSIQDYLRVAKDINDNKKIKVISIQHEFKIFGSDYGEPLLTFLKKIEKPVIITMHTVLPKPSDYRKKIVQLLSEKCSQIVVMNQFAVDILHKDYGIKRSKISVIPHGIHEVKFGDNRNMKKQWGFQNRRLITSFGFMRPGRGDRSSGRGYEYILEILPEIMKRFPDVLYVIAGVTHPNTLKCEGEQYRNILMEEVRRKGLQKNVKFINKFLSLTELLSLLKSTDVYISSNQNPFQITSGTLSYAMGCGRAVVSTPFLHAKEIINEKRGFLAKFDDSKSFKDAILALLGNPILKKRMEKNAYLFTRHMTWQNVGKQYQKLFNRYLDH